MDLEEYVAILRRRWWVVAFVTTLGVAAGLAQTAATQPLYRSTSKVFTSLAKGDTVGELVQGSTYTQNLVASFSQLVTMPVVLDPVRKDLGLPQSSKALAGAITADTPLNTVIIEISAVDPSPKRAADIANAVAAQLSSTVARIAPTASDGSASVRMDLVSMAQPPRIAFTPKRSRNVVLFGGLGFLLGIFGALAWSKLDTRVRTEADLPIAPERPVLGTVSRSKELAASGHHAILARPHAPLAESYRRIRTNLRFFDVSSPARVFVVTSSVQGEGKSTTSLALALVMAENNSRVLLIDGDLRRPSVDRLAGLEGSVGLSTVLVGDISLSDAAQPWGAPGLDVLTSGVIPPNPSQIINSSGMTALLKEVRELYDIVIIDSPPLLALSDAAVLARLTDGALLVAGCRTVHRNQISQAMLTLDTVGARCIGLIANNVKTGKAGAYYRYESDPLLSHHASS